MIILSSVTSTIMAVLFKNLFNVRPFLVAASMATTSSVLPTYETLHLSRPVEYVVQVELNRPEKRNAMNLPFWREMIECFPQLHNDPDTRCVIINGAGQAFTAGLDLTDVGQVFVTGDDDVGRKSINFMETVIKPFQDAFTGIEKCRKPVIAAIHGYCIGGGVDLITACDIRLCTSDAWFQIKEVDLGLAADVGTLQRLPKIVGNDSLVRELAYTGRKFTADEAHSMGLVSHVFPDQSSMMSAAIKMATTIASKSPIAVQGTKININYSRDHTVDESLEHMRIWNMSMLQSEDVMKSIQAMIQKEPPDFYPL